MKLSKQEKDKYPKIYGYGSVEQLEADSTRFGDDPNNPLTHWVLMKDADKDVRFIPCTEEYFHWHRNEARNESRRKDTESRCLIPSKKYGLIKCRENCHHCPYKQDKNNPEKITWDYARTGTPISIDFMSDNYNYEFSSDDNESTTQNGGSFRLMDYNPTEDELELLEERMSIIKELMRDLSLEDQTIINLFGEGKTDAAIAKIVKKSRSTVQGRRIKLIELLKQRIESRK